MSRASKPDSMTPVEIRQAVDRLYAAAVANGTHREGPALTVCQGCRRWVKSIAYITLDHKRLCRDCDPTKTPPATAKGVGGYF